MMPFVAMVGRGGDVGAADLSASLLTKSAAEGSSGTFAQVAFDGAAFGASWRSGSNAVVPPDVTLARPMFQISHQGTTKLEGQVRVGGSSYFGLPYVSSDSLGLVSVNAFGAFKSVTPGDSFGLYAASATSGDIGPLPSLPTWLAVERISASINYCLVGKSGNQAIASSTNTALTWQTEVVDTLGFHNTSSDTSRFTIPSGTTGLFRITANAAASATSSTGAILSITKNGAYDPGLPVRDQEHSGVIFLNVASAIVEATAGDYFEIIFRSGGSAVNVGSNDYCWAQIEEVQPCSRALGYRTGTLALSGSTFTTVPMQATVYDNDGWLSSGNFVVPSGVSYVRAAFAIEGASQTSDLQGLIYINGARFEGMPFSDNDTTGADFVSGISGIIPVNPGDVISLVAFSTSARNITANTWLSVEAVAVSTL